MNLLPAQMLLGLALCASLFFGGYFLGKSDGRVTCMAAQAKVQQAGQSAADKESSRREVVGMQREASHEQIRVVYRTLKEKVDENVKNNPAVNTCGLDAGGLLLWNAANAGDSAPMPGEPDYGLCSTTGSEVREIGGLVPQPHRGDGAVLTVPGPAWARRFLFACWGA